MEPLYLLEVRGGKLSMKRGTGDRTFPVYGPACLIQRSSEVVFSHF